LSATRRDILLSLKWDNPSRLVKTYAEERFAEMLVNEGKFRLWPLEYFREIEDPSRKDQREGQLITGGPKGVRHSRFQGNPKFLFCVSGADVDPASQRRFGKYVVQIGDPTRFAQDLHAWLNQSQCGEMIGSIECLKVLYGVHDDLVFNQHGDSLIYSNKPAEYAQEKEYRIVLIGKADARQTSYLDVDLGWPLPYLKRVEQRA
jgi:hypothetical protein